MKLSRFVPFLLVAGAPLLLVAACGGSQSERGLETEAGNEAAPDVIVGENDATTTPDVGTDAVADGTMVVMGSDSGSDSTTNENDGTTSPETSADSGPDSTMMMETGTTDTGSDSTTETGTVQDAGAEVVVEAAVEAGPDATIMDAASEAMSEASADAPADSMGTVDAGSDAVADTGGGGSDASDGGCTLSVADSGVGGTLNWAENFGTMGYTTATAVALDPTNGDVVVAGYLDGTANFGGGSIESHGDAASGYDTFVARFDKNGNYKWAKDFGNGLSVTAQGAAVDSSGNVAIGGNFQGAVSFGGGTLTAVGNLDLFLVEFDSAGSHLWSESFGSSGNDQLIDSVVVDGTGSVLVAGYGTSVDFGGGALTGDYIAKFSSAGTYSWDETFATSSALITPTLAVDADSNVVFAGAFSGTANLGAGTATSVGGGDAFVAKYAPSGANLWVQQYTAVPQMLGANSGSSVGGLAVDACGNIFFAGTFGAQSTSATISFGSGTLTSDPVNATAFLAKIDSVGSGVWSKVFVGSNSDALYPGNVAADGAGGVTFTFGLAGSVNYGGGSLTSPSDEVPTISVASFDAAGAYRWAFAEESPSTATTSATGGLAGNGASVVVVGTFGNCSLNCNDGTSPANTTLVLPGKTLDAVSAGDLFIASLAP
jgi:hypothetical protein